MAGVEQQFGGARIGDVGLHGDGTAAAADDGVNDLLRFDGIAGVVDDHGVAIGCQLLRDRCADAARGAGDDGYGRRGVGLAHGAAPNRWGELTVLIDANRINQPNKTSQSNQAKQSGQ